MSKKEKSAVYNILAFNFQGKKTAAENVKQLKKSGALDGQMIVAEAIVSVDDKGKTHIHEPGHGITGGAVGAVAGGLLGLIGGPVGLLAWAVGGAVVGGVAGKYLGRPFSKGDLEVIGDAMAPDTSAFLLLVEDVESETVINKMEGYNANVVTLTVGDEISGQIASYVAVEAHDDQGTAAAGEAAVAADDEGKPMSNQKVVTPETFIRAETDKMFQAMIINAGGTNKFYHFRNLTPLDKQTVIRMNRDVLYSGGTFDAEKELTVNFPEMPDDRYASIQILDNDHYLVDILYNPGKYKIKGGTRFLFFIVRIQLLDPSDQDEIAMVNTMQDKFVVKSETNGEFPGFHWDTESLDRLRDEYKTEADKLPNYNGTMAKRGQVAKESKRHLVAAAAWGLFPEQASIYLNYGGDLDSDKCYAATYEVPENDAFWSISVYGSDGYIKSNDNLINAPLTSRKAGIS
jgi:uncharacterized membrane protein